MAEHRATGQGRDDSCRAAFEFLRPEPCRERRFWMQNNWPRVGCIACVPSPENGCGALPGEPITLFVLGAFRPTAFRVGKKGPLSCLLEFLTRGVYDPITGGPATSARHGRRADGRGPIEVFIVDNLGNSKLPVLDRIGRIAGRPAADSRSSTCATPRRFRQLSPHRFEAIHLPALRRWGNRGEGRSRITTTTLGQRGAVRVRGRSRVRTIVFSSSATVYGEPAQRCQIPRGFPAVAAGILTARRS